MRHEGWTGLGGVLGLLAQFALILALQAPQDSLLAEAQREVREATDERWILQADRATSGLFSGITLHDAGLYSGEATSWGVRYRPALTLETLSLRRSPLAWLTDREGVSFEAALYGGTLQGAASRSEGETTLSFLAKGLDLSQLPLSGSGRILRAEGRLRAEGDLALRWEDIRGSTGRLSLQIDSFTLYIGLLGGLSLRETVAFREAALDMAVEHGKLQVVRGVFASDPVAITLGGGISFAETLRRTRLQLKIQLEFPAELDALLQGAPSFQRARSGEGEYRYILSGTALLPSFREDRIGCVRRAPGNEPSPRREQIEAQLRAEDAGLSDEEREERRAKRLEQMQERMRLAAGSGGASP